jgi:hypothetical protein
MLENHGALDSRSFHRSSVDFDASFLEREETGDDVEERRFTAAARTHDGHELPLSHFKRDLGESENIFGLALEPVPLRDAVED